MPGLSFDPGAWLALLRDHGPWAIVVLLIYGGARGWYVWRWHYDRLITEVEEWKTRWKEAEQINHDALRYIERRFE